MMTSVLLRGRKPLLRWLCTIAPVLGVLCLSQLSYGQQRQAGQMLKQLLKQFPAADTNKDGTLSIQEAQAFRKRMQRDGKRGVPQTFETDPGWERDRFPDNAVCYLPPEEIAKLYATVRNRNQPTIAAFEKPQDGALRVIGTGHSFMQPGYKTLPLISRGAGMDQPLYTHVGGGITGSVRYKWEQENGIFQFDGKPLPKLLSSLSNSNWDVMMFGPYYNDKAAYYSCWIDFALKYNPQMKFYISDAWPQLTQHPDKPTSESFFTEQVLDQMGRDRRFATSDMLNELKQQYPGKIFVMPTSDAMILAAKRFVRGELPGVEGLHRLIGKKQRSLWTDQICHLGPGFDRLEGYVFYASIYGRSPELIDQPIAFSENPSFPGDDLDSIFRSIAWQAVSRNPNTGVTDRNNDGLAD